MQKLLLITALATTTLAIAQEKTGINTVNPSASLDIVSKGNDANTKALEINNADATEMVTILDNGKVGVGINYPKYKLDVDGTLRALNDFRLDFMASEMSFSILEDRDMLGWVQFRPEDSLKYKGFAFLSSPDEPMLVMTRSAKVGIGTTTPTEKLHVIGNILASGSITPDYVFEKYYNGESDLKAEYQMMSLQEVEAYTKLNKHLPGVPSVKEVKENGGILVNRATEINLEKIEELYLHTIEQEKKIEAQQVTIENQQNQIDELKALMKKVLKNKQ